MFHCRAISIAAHHEECSLQVLRGETHRCRPVPAQTLTLAGPMMSPSSEDPRAGLCGISRGMFLPTTNRAQLTGRSPCRRFAPADCAIQGSLDATNGHKTCKWSTNSPTLCFPRKAVNSAEASFRVSTPRGIPCSHATLQRWKSLSECSRVSSRNRGSLNGMAVSVTTRQSC
jgi:hypothetical protein